VRAAVTAGKRGEVANAHRDRARESPSPLPPASSPCTRDEERTAASDAILTLAEDLGRFAADLWSEGRLDGTLPDDEGSDDDEEE
jgi:hypothetical protein